MFQADSIQVPLYELVHDVVGMNSEIGQNNRAREFRLLGFWRQDDDDDDMDDEQLVSELEQMRMARMRIAAC